MTEKKMKEQLRRIWYHLDQLQNALNEAHHTTLIRYTGEYDAVAPCSTMSELRRRIKLTTMEAISEAVVAEVRKR